MMRYYTTQQVAKILNTDVQIVRHKCREGHIPAIRPPGFRDWRIPVADLEKLLWDVEEQARMASVRDATTKAGNSRPSLDARGVVQGSAEGERVGGRYGYAMTPLPLHYRRNRWIISDRSGVPRQRQHIICGAALRRYTIASKATRSHTESMGLGISSTGAYLRRAHHGKRKTQTQEARKLYRTKKQKRYRFPLQSPNDKRQAKMGEDPRLARIHRQKGSKATSGRDAAKVWWRLDDRPL